MYPTFDIEIYERPKKEILIMDVINERLQINFFLSKGK